MELQRNSWSTQAVAVEEVNRWLDVLRAKWKQIPAGLSERDDTSRLNTLGDEELTRLYEAAHRESTAGEGFSARGWYHLLYGDILRGKRVLDVGSGFGIDGITFARAGAHITFLDIVESNLEVLRRLCAVYGIRDAEFCYLDELSALDALGDYDVIWCQGSMLNAPFEVVRSEAAALLRHLKVGGRWIELAYPRGRWMREGYVPFDKWGAKTDGGAPWIEWYSLEKMLARLEPVPFEVVLHFEFHCGDFNWFDLVRTG